MAKPWDAVFIGGGAAGLCGAIMLKRQQPALRVCILEKAPRVGKKLLSTGNGTCNLSNMAADVRMALATPDGMTAYHGQHPDFALTALLLFPPSNTQAFFRSIGVDTVVRENGRIYPACASAAAVLDCLRCEIEALGIAVQTEQAVQNIEKTDSGFALSCVKADGTAVCEQARRVVVTAGGCASPSLGGGMDGYRLLEAMGHERTALFPSIVQIKTDTAFVRAVKGLRVQAKATLRMRGLPPLSETGEVLFTEYGLSGPAVMQVSRAAGDWERRRKGELSVVLDLLPNEEEEALYTRLCARKAALGGRTLEDFLTGILQRRVGQTVLRAAGVLPLNRAVSTLTDAELRAVAHTLKSWRFAVQGTAGFGSAQVTAGGISTAKFDPRTLQSTVCAGLYAAGEVLDVDGDCGGFNLQWAWASASAVAAAIAEEVRV